MSKNKDEDFFNLKDEKEQSDDDNFEIALKKKQFEGKKGEMLLELQKSYKGDNRFKLDNKFSNDIEVNKISYGVRELTDVFDRNKMGQKQEINKNLNQNKNKNKQKIISIEEELRNEKQRNISVLSQVISNQDFLTIKPKTTNHQSLIIKRFDPVLNIGKEIQNKVEEPEKVDNNKIKLKRGVDFESTVKNSYHENIEEFNLEKKLEINVDAWKSLNAQNKEKKKDKTTPTTFLLFSDSQPVSNNTQPYLLFNENKENNVEEKDQSVGKDKIKKSDREVLKKENENDIKEKKKKKELTLLEKKEIEMKKKLKIESKKEKIKRRKEDRENREKDIEEKMKQDFGEAYGVDKTNEYMRIVKMIKEKKFQNLGKKREKSSKNKHEKE